jgi:protein ImuA
MIKQLRQSLRALERPAGLETEAGCLPFGVVPIDAALGGGLARGALHEIAAPSEAHLTAAAGFALGLVCLPSSHVSLSSPFPLAGEFDRRRRSGGGLMIASPPPHPSPASGGGSEGLHAGGSNNIIWIAEDMALTESGAPYGPGLDVFALAPERLLTVAAAHRRDLLWAMEEALRCRAVRTVIGEWRQGAIDMVALRRLSLAAAEHGALALLLRAAPANEASTAATRWIVGAAPSFSSPPRGGGKEGGAPRFVVHLVRNRRGPNGSWILQWSDSDERFLLVPHAQPVAAPARDRPHRKVA